MTVYGDPMEVLDGRDILTLLGCSQNKDKESRDCDDPRNVFSVRKHSIDPSSSAEDGTTDGSDAVNSKNNNS